MPAVHDARYISANVPRRYPFFAWFYLFQLAIPIREAMPDLQLRSVAPNSRSGEGEFHDDKAKSSHFG
jgi:hypothetical protein